MDIRIEGSERLIRILQGLTTETDGVIERGMEKGAKIMQGSIKKRVPVDTGQLRNSISVEKVDTCKYAIGTNVEHAIFVEFGTGLNGDPKVCHTTKPYWTYFKDGRFIRTHGALPAHYMQDGFFEAKDEVVKCVTDEIRKEIQRYGGR